MTTSTSRQGAPARDDRVGAPSRVSRAARVLEGWADHPVVRAEGHAWEVLDVGARDDALVVRRALEDGGVGLWGLGTPDGVAHLLLDEPALTAGVVRSSLPRGTSVVASALAEASGSGLPVHLRTDPVSRWDWFTATTQPPAQPGESRVVALDGPRGRAVARALLDRANPAAELDPRDPGTRWWGWQDDAGDVRGVAGARCARRGAPWVLGGIATDPGARGRGVARAVTAAATRSGRREESMVELGMYADNGAARRVYEHVGYRVTQAFESRR